MKRYSSSKYSNLVEDAKPSKEELVRSYWGESKSTTDIARIYGVAHRSVILWMKKHGIPRRKIGRHPWINVNLKPSNSLCYVLGVLAGDGTLDKSGIKLEVKSKEFADSFARATKEIGFNSTSRINKRGYHVVRACSLKFVRWVKNLDIVNLCESSRYMWPFIRGFYESEGNITLRHTGAYRELRITNTNLELISKIQRFLESQSFTPHLRVQQREQGERCKKAYTLAISRHDKIREFLGKANPCIKAKN